MAVNVVEVIAPAARPGAPDCRRVIAGFGEAVHAALAVSFAELAASLRGVIPSQVNARQAKQGD